MAIIPRINLQVKEILLINIVLGHFPQYLFVNCTLFNFP
jgi:hypothetical protein